MSNHQECCRCGESFDYRKEGICYQGREGVVYMCEQHVPDKFRDEGLAEDMGVTLREEDDQWDDAHEESRCPYCGDNHCGGWCG